QGIIKDRNILRYYEVADRHFFQNARGECLPSRIETGEIEITNQKMIVLRKSFNNTSCFFRLD
ncbi:MAG: hypothetical protein IIZ93_10420, partial [Acidaminococcaceae bacterium]|nr:hypothetical protein [Acidaminococcaceae bacterium]